MQIYGVEFLRYVLFLDDLDASLDSLSTGQQATLESLRLIAQPGVEPPGGYAPIQIDVAYRLGTYLQDRQMTVCSALRMQSGGVLTEFDEIDELLRSLLVIAQDSWPILLLPRPDDLPLHFANGISHVTHNHPAAARVAELMLADQQLKLLFPQDTSVIDVADFGQRASVASHIIYSSGRGSGLQLILLPEFILMNARYREILTSGSDAISFYFDCVKKVLTEVRQLARGKEVNVPLVIGLSGMDVADDIRLETSFGSIRKFRERDTVVLKQWRDWLAKPTAVIETTYALKLLSIRGAKDVSDNPIEESHWKAAMPKFEEYRRRSEERVDLLRYSLLLASDEGVMLTPSIVSRAVLDPMQSGPSLEYPLQTLSRASLGKLDSEVATHIVQWVERVRQYHPSDLNLGVRRLLSAMVSRLDPVDGLIDAVVCWENAFGTDQETMFRVCAAMARLLQPEDVGARDQLFRELKNLYGIRSKVVHGSKELSFSEAEEYRVKAVQYALDAMRKLYDYPTLMKIKESAVRGSNLILEVGLVEAEESVAE